MRPIIKVDFMVLLKKGSDIYELLFTSSKTVNSNVYAGRRLAPMYNCIVKMIIIRVDLRNQFSKLTKENLD